ncbi:uncharacterized protein LOC143878689 [Tasmannia lanceolata]|uniref:uncharacterized protein LOC143849038 n=1 Tax=Tasmannia lanceolata TaxID=3420 RepID=UPI004063010C
MYDYIDLFPPNYTPSGDFPITGPTPPATLRLPSLPDQFTANGFASIAEALAVLKSDGGNSNFGFPSSLPTYLHRPIAIQRSSSSHSLQKDNSRPLFSPRGILDLQAGSMRRVLSTGDLQRTNSLKHSHRSESPLGHENCGVDGITKVGRYTAEERRERIERYRSKRNQRNFHKKIKYACRKTLADSRPRVRGRFARNEETGDNLQSQWIQTAIDEEDEDEDVWNNFLDAFSMNLIP